VLLPVRKQELKKKELTVNPQLLFLNKKRKPLNGFLFLCSGLCRRKILKSIQLHKFHLYPA
jgi:hypothetical protein